MPDVVADASAVLVVILKEPGSDVVQREVADGRLVVSAVNVAEVLTKLIDRGANLGEASGLVHTLQLEVVAFDRNDSERATALRPSTRSLGLSLADRACLALGINRSLPILTADRAWLQLQLPVPVVLTR